MNCIAIFFISLWQGLKAIYTLPHPSQKWAIFLPNRNLYEKSISWPLGSPKVRSTNGEYWKYFNILGKHHYQHSFNSDSLASRSVWNLINDSFENIRNLLNTIFSQNINRFYSENPIFLWFWTNIADILHFDFWLWGTLEAMILTHKSFC